MSALGQKLQEARLEAGLSGADVAAAARIGGPMLSLIENGHRTPSLDTLQSLARALRIEIVIGPSGAEVRRAA